VQIIIITPGASASRKGMSVKHVEGRARRGDCLEGDLTWGNQWNARSVMGGKRRRPACGWKGICQPNIILQVLNLLDVCFSSPSCFVLFFQVPMP